MAGKFNPGDPAFIVESSRFILEVTIVKYAGGLYIIHFKDSNGGIKVRENRLFKAREAAEATIPNKVEKPKYRSPWDYHKYDTVFALSP